MRNATSIEVKCECAIPFQSEIITYIEKVIDGSQEDYDPGDVPHKEVITQAIRSKLVFIKFHFARSIKKIKPKLLQAIKKTFKKELIGTIREGKNEITFILL